MFKGLFGKRKKDVIDLTEMKKEEVAETSGQPTENSGAYKDLTGAGGENVDLFSAISGSESSQPSGAISPNTGVSNKIDDMEFKLDNLRKKLDDVLNRIEVIEKKSGVYGR